MRVIRILVLILLVAAVALFAYQNNDRVTLQYLNSSLTLPMSILIAAVYVLGMLSGWTVFGLLRRSWRRVADRP
jgi:uncharacterized membrane protein YciS (DUF1049 family)